MKKIPYKRLLIFALCMIFPLFAFEYQNSEQVDLLIEIIFEKMMLSEGEIKNARQNMEEKASVDSTEISLSPENPVVTEKIRENAPALTETIIEADLLEVLPTPEPTPRPEWIPIDMEVPENKKVEEFRQQYLSNFGKKWTYTVMDAGKPYRKFIQRKVKEYNMPSCFEFLPVIESNFKVDALSRSGALGMWQFMKNSIAAYNIRSNEWIDERKDPWISTDAALKKLVENKKSLGDWYLALAAYNAGLGRVRSAIKKSGGKADYWYLSEKKLLPNETINYVPKFLAISEIITNSAYYGIELPILEEDEQAFSYLETNSSLDITLLAEKLQVEASVLQFLNPSLNYNITPPTVKYLLRLPAGMQDQAQQIITEEGINLIKYYVHTVRSGDSLFALALHYDISVAMIEKANPGIKPHLLNLGQKVLVPVLKETTPYSNQTADHKIVYSGNYTIQQGDTLWNLALKYGVQVEELAEVNNFSVNMVLRVGSTIKVPIIQ